ncbi:heme ABC exporter ATP-binding protein CcmA [uncultured Kiloniella sp.]|uniref:heme ABC exporter ATP-binding protein CcmA n=1 Tax=uncultured Kiloniella sp. TaxID=1133091 RepID=UPI0026376F69|nr:heme ABC exporter ATP-binding protein CcmA [uncultured Kiloniella sp.]
MGSSLFQGEDLTCIRGGRTVFLGLNFNLAQGQALILEGPNGSGKSSLIRMLSGLVRPKLGKLVWQDQDATREPEIFQRHIHYIGHRNAIKPVLTVLENLAYWSGKKKDDPSLDDALDHFRMLPLKHTPANLLSSGQSRRLTLSRLLASERSVWLLDEPSVGLDVASVALLEDVIKTHRSKGGAIIFATHSPINVENPNKLNLQDYSPLYNKKLLAVENEEDSWI